MSTILNSRGMLVGLGLMAAVSVAACSTHPAGNVAGTGNPHTGTPTAAATSNAAGPSITPGGASASSPPRASTWLAASEIPFGTTYSWSLFTGNGNSQPIGTAEGNGAYYISPDTVFQAITSCGSPSLILSSPLGAWQRQFQPTAGTLHDMAGQWISFYPDATAAQAAWHELQAAYAGCPAQEGHLPITLMETAQNQDGMAWFHNNNGAIVDMARYVHEYFVLHDNQIAYLYVEGGGPALASTPNDAQVLATIARHLNA